MKDQLDAMLSILNNTIPPLIGEGLGKEITGRDETIEGVFNGEKMVGADGKEYAVPPNYASKSKLVEGDMMKLTVSDQGRFIFKQIGPIKRKRLVGQLAFDPINGQWRVVADNRPYQVLLASVTFYRAAPGDQLVILVPKDGESSWGAVENVIRC